MNDIVLGIVMMYAGPGYCSLFKLVAGRLVVGIFWRVFRLFLVIQSGKVSTHKFNIALSATVNKTSLSEDGKTLTVPEQAEAISLNLILDSSNNLKIGSTSVLTWEDGYVPSGDDNAYGNAPLTGEKFAYGILVLFAASLAGVLLIRKRINVR